MNCRRIRHLLLDFVDGLGNETLHAEVERHLSVCSECEAFSHEMKQSLALLRRVPMEPLDDNFNWKVRLAIHREQKSSTRRAASAGAWVQAWNLRYVASMGVAFAMVLGAGVVAMKYIGSTGMSVEPAVTAAPTVRSAPRDYASPSTRGSSLPVGGSQSRLVSDGSNNARVAESTAARGAIDRYAQEVAMDSLIDARLVTMTPEMRRRCIQRQIHRLQSQLESQAQATPSKQP